MTSPKPPVKKDYFVIQEQRTHNNHRSRREARDILKSIAFFFLICFLVKQLSFSESRSWPSLWRPSVPADFGTDTEAARHEVPIFDREESDPEDFHQRDKKRLAIFVLLCVGMTFPFFT